MFSILFQLFFLLFFASNTCWFIVIIKKYIKAGRETSPSGSLLEYPASEVVGCVFKS